jgi:hypothetical protein
MAIHANNFSYLGGKAMKITSLKSAQAKVARFYFKNKMKGLNSSSRAFA